MTTKNAPHLYQEIAESIRRRIASGDFAPGDRLPSIRDMAKQWQCTPSTVNRAYAILTEEGLVSGHRGSGTRVTENPLPDERPFLRQAQLINQAEHFLLETIGQGYTPQQTQSALSVAIARWETFEQQIGPSKQTIATDTKQTLRFVGSHDSIVDLLFQQFVDGISVQFSGSLGGLLALARGEADLAGSHLWDEATDSYNIPFVKRILPNQAVALVTVAKRDLGLILPAGNPQKIKTLADLARPDMRWINRQAGSGTRVWLDVQLQRLGIKTEAITGYDQERATHLAVAQVIARGEATAGLGIYPAAIAYELDFIPLTQEVYQLIIPQAIWQTPVCQALLGMMTSPDFLEMVKAMGGYETAVTGDVTWL